MHSIRELIQVVKTRFFPLPYRNCPLIGFKRISMSLAKASHAFSLACVHTFWYYRSHMEFIQSVVLPSLPYVQIILSILLIAAILLQQRGSSLGGAFGGDNFSATFHKRRGSELFLFRFSIAIAILFVLSALLNVIF